MVLLQSVYHFAPDLNTSTATRWIAIKLKAFNVAQKMNLNYLGDPLYFPVMPLIIYGYFMSDISQYLLGSCYNISNNFCD